MRQTDSVRILIIGGGGREHALAWKLSQEAEVICVPGSAGISEDVECVAIATHDFAKIIKLAKERAVELIVVGPEDPLVAGLADALRESGFPTFGPGQVAAQLEGSKAFAKAMMQRAGVPTAAYQSFIDVGASKEYVKREFAEGRQVALKASGNALGKGVIVCNTLTEALEGIDTLKTLGEAGRTLVIEERLIGREFSLLTMVSEKGILSRSSIRTRDRIPVEWEPTPLCPGLMRTLSRKLKKKSSSPFFRPFKTIRFHTEGCSLAE
jgi:phosphoribosylamine--glycine ligase